MLFLTLSSVAIWLLPRSDAQEAASDYYYRSVCSVAGDTSNCTGLFSTIVNDAVYSNSQYRVNVTQQKLSISINPTIDGHIFPTDRVAIQRLTVEGASPIPSESDLVIMVQEPGTIYWSVDIPLNGEASVYNNSIGPQCDSAQMPNSSSRFYTGNGVTAGITDTADPLNEKVGARVEEMQPPSKLNAWPIVLELENRPVADNLIVRLQTGGSDVVQQCGFGQGYTSGFGFAYYFGAGSGYLAIDRFILETWYNDTSSPTTSPSSFPTTEPTVPTAVPTDMPSQDPTTGAPSNNPTTMPTGDPTEVTIDSSEDPQPVKDESDNGLAIGLGVAGGVVALLIVVGVVYYFLVVKK